MISEDPASSAGRHFDEHRWLRYVMQTLETMNEEVYTRIPVSIFSVPKSLLSSKPEAYIPQIIALGPYHHFDSQLYQMEQYKLATAKRTQRRLQHHADSSFQQIVHYCIKKEHEIRSSYHKHIDRDVQTLAWMMAIDASFLLEFLHNFSDAKGPSMWHMDFSGIKFACNSILTDMVVLENQIPLFLVRKLLVFQRSSGRVADDELSKMLIGFLNKISPFKATQNLTNIGRIKGYAHLLQLLYYVIVATVKDDGRASSSNNNNEIIENVIDIPDSTNERGQSNSEYTKKLLDSVWISAAGLHVMSLLIVKPIEFLLKVPWPIVGTFCKAVRRSYDPLSSDPLLAEEIDIPSVMELIKAGVRFSATEGDLSTIDFDVRTTTFYLPVIDMDRNTETVLRNLLAYEAVAELSEPPVLARYVELMNGIIDTGDDVRALRQAGVIAWRRMKSDDEVAKMWNGLGKAAPRTAAKVEVLDRVIADVNGYYKGLLSVKARRFLKSYVMGSWQLLTFLAAILLLLLTCIDAFCSVFRCGSAIFP